jgi:hypothetical protein
MSGITSKAQYGFADTDLAVSGTGMIQRDVKIFRVGTFTDMFGRTKTWTGDQLDLAASHFRQLRTANILPNIPVREDHSLSIKDVVGYFLDVRRSGDFMVCDIEWATTAAKDNWDSGKYRNRSIEIGEYTTNDGTKYDPVVLGLAFVDLPAVEGLYRIADHGDDHMTKPNTSDQAAADQAAADQAAADQAAADQAAADQAAADQAAADQAAADQAAADQAAADQAAADQAAADQAAADAGKPLVGAHSRPHAFRIHGAEVYDYAAVQAHIIGLETFRDETIQGARLDFVAGLSSGNIITSAQADSFRKLVPTMSVEQFDQFKAGFEGAAPANLFGRHDLGQGDGNGAGDATADRISILEGIVASHRARGTSEEAISKMGSFVELQTLKNAK